MSDAAAQKAPPQTQAEPHRNPTYFDNPAIDALMDVVLELGGELWVTRQRMNILEAILRRRGDLGVTEIAQFRASDEERAAWEAQREEYVQRVYRALALVGSAKEGRDQMDNMEQG